MFKTNLKCTNTVMYMAEYATSMDFLDLRIRLDILSNGNDPPSIGHYIGDCFGDLHRVIFAKGERFKCTHMKSKDGEQVKFPNMFVLDKLVS